MRNLLMLADTLSSPEFMRRRRTRKASAAGTAATATATTKPKKHQNTRAQSRLPPPLAVVYAEADADAEDTSESSGSGCSIVTTTSSNERLHLVLARRTKGEMAELYQELWRNERAQKVYVYTDSPLTARGSLSKRQTFDVLSRVALQCTCMETLHLDFSNEFGPHTDLYLRVNVLSRVLEEAPQLQQLVLKDVPLKGTPEEVRVLQRNLKTHRGLQRVELKWCLEVTDATQPVLPGLLKGLMESPCLTEFTLLASCGGAAHQLPLPLLATSKSIHKLKVALEQRHSIWQSVEQREMEQQLLLTLLQDLKHNPIITDLTVYAQHWKSQESVQAVIDLVQATGSNTSAITKMDLVDYGYGNDQPHRLVELARALKYNPRLQHFKLHTKKKSIENNNNSNNNATNNHYAAAAAATVSSSSSSSNPTMISIIYNAMLDCAMHNTVLESMDISHCNLTLNTTATVDDNDNNNKDTTNTCQQQQQQGDLIQFYLHANHNGIRRNFLQHDFSPEEWVQLVTQEQYNRNTPLLFYLLQSNPSLLLSRRKVIFES